MQSSLSLQFGYRSNHRYALCRRSSSHPTCNSAFCGSRLEKSINWRNANCSPSKLPLPVILDCNFPFEYQSFALRRLPPTKRPTVHTVKRSALYGVKYILIGNPLDKVSWRRRHLPCFCHMLNASAIPRVPVRWRVMPQFLNLWLSVPMPGQ